MKTIPTLIGASLFGASLLLTSCGGNSKKEAFVINLDTVLDQFKATADSMADDNFVATNSSTQASPIPLQPADDKLTEFTASFKKNLNAKNVLPNSTIGVISNSDGSFLGFNDENKNSNKDAQEKDLFKIEVDDERSRLIISDLQHTEYRRESSYHMGGGGFFTGYLIGSMMSRQSYSGVDTRRYSSMSTSPKGYHSNAVKSVSSKSSSSNSARTSSGSRSFRSGK